MGKPKKIKSIRNLRLKTTLLMENLKQRATQLGMDAASKALNIRKK